jgi:hypothetical protein
MKRVANTGEPPVVVPVVVVAVDVHLALVVPTIERDEIVRDIVYVTTPRILSELPSYDDCSVHLALGVESYSAS